MAETRASCSLCKRVYVWGAAPDVAFSHCPTCGRKLHERLLSQGWPELRLVPAEQLRLQGVR